MFQSKKSKLFASIALDLVGMSSYILPFLGETTDLFWAPIAGYIMTLLYPGKTGVAAGIITTIEELVPGMDIIPTFTLTWLFTYVFNKSDQKPTIDVPSK